MSNDVSTNKDPMTEFRERVITKLKDDIGSMIPDEALQGLVTRAVEEEFFKERRIPQNFGRDEIKPSWFVEEVGKIAEPMIREHVEKYINENKDIIQKGVDQFLESQNLTLLTSAMISRELSNHIFQALQPIFDMISSRS